MEEENIKFQQDGYVIVKKLFDAEEVAMLYQATLKDERMTKNSFRFLPPFYSYSHTIPYIYCLV